MRSTPSSTSKSRHLTSSFNSMMDGLTGSSGHQSLSGARSPDLETLETMSVRSDESVESEMGWTMVSDHLDIGEGLFRVNKSTDGFDRFVKIKYFLHLSIVLPIVTKYFFM